MNKKIYICCLSLLIVLLMTRVVSAQEIASCDDGISVLDKKSYEILAKVDISDGDVIAYRQLLAECVANYQSYSAGKRNDFLRLLNTLLARVDKVYLNISSEGLYLPEGASKKMQRRSQHILEIKEVMQRLYISMLSQRPPLDQGWGDRNTTNLFLGYETVDVDGLSRYGAGRFGVSFYSQMSDVLGETETLALHLFGAALLTNSAENSDSVVSDTHEIDLNLFMPYSMVRSNKGHWALGPVAGITMRKFAGISISRWKYMAGVRAARSADLYFEARYGKSEGVSGQRIELKGQLPVMSALNGDVIVGGTLNLSIDDGASSGDVIQAYVLWQVDFLELLNVY